MCSVKVREKRAENIGEQSFLTTYIRKFDAIHGDPTESIVDYELKIVIYRMCYTRIAVSLYVHGIVGFVR